MRPEPGLTLRALAPGGTPRTRRYRVMIPANPMSVRRTLQDSIRHCRAASVPAETCGDLELVLAEVLNNIVEHAQAGRERGVIDLDLRVDERCVRCTVLDDGRAMPGGILPEGSAPSPDVPQAALPEGGFGWSLIRGMTNDLGYRRDRDWNRITFAVPFCRPTPVGQVHAALTVRA